MQGDSVLVLINPKTGEDMSFRPMVKTTQDEPFAGNGQRFATQKEAEDSSIELMGRWFSVIETKVEESIDPVNYKFVDGRNVRIEEDNV